MNKDEWMALAAQMQDRYHESLARIKDLEGALDELREVLLDVGAKTHRSKKLYNWYVENSDCYIEVEE